MKAEFPKEMSKNSISKSRVKKTKQLAGFINKFLSNKS